MNGGEHGALYERVGRLEMGAVRIEEQHADVVRRLEEMKGSLDRIGERIMTREDCRERHSRLEDSVKAHVEATSGAAGRVWRGILQGVLTALATAAAFVLIRGGL